MSEDPVQELLRLSGEVGAQAERMHARRLALARFALVWWQGGAARAYQEAVQERVVSLAELEARLLDLSRACHDLASRYAAQSVGEHPGVGLAR